MDGLLGVLLGGGRSAVSVASTLQQRVVNRTLLLDNPTAQMTAGKAFHRCVWGGTAQMMAGKAFHG